MPGIRRPGYLRRQWAWHFPRWLCFLDIRGEMEPKAGFPKSRVERLKEWTAKLIELQGEEYGNERWGRGFDGRSYFRWIGTAVDGRATVWIVAGDTERALHALGVWGLVERDWLHLGSKADRNRATGDEYSDQGQQCPLVLAPETAIATFTVAESARTVKFLSVTNYGVERPPHNLTADETICYLERSMVCVTGQVRALNLGSIRCTASAQGWHGWLHSYADVRPVIHTCQGALNLEVEAIHGGRCEVFHYGVVPGPVNHLDFASHYPSICAEVDLPCRLVGYTQRGYLPGLSDLCRRFCCFASCLVETDEPNYPFKYNGELIFPVGRFRTVLCGPELELALERGHVKKTGRISWYARYPLLSRISELFLCCRARATRTGDKMASQWSKRCANGLIGKFASRSLQWDKVKGYKNTPNWGLWYQADEHGIATQYRSLGGTVERLVDYGYIGDSFPAIAAAVYAHGRVRLLAAIESIGWGAVHYADTDALFISAESTGVSQGLPRQSVVLPSGLRNVGRYQSVSLFGRKFYAVDGRIVCAGLPGSRDGEISSFGTVVVNQSLMGSLAQGHMPDNAELQREWFDNEEVMTGRLKFGGRVEPIEIWEK